MIEHKVEIGDTVYLARPTRAPITVECPDCRGTREWTVSAPGREDWVVGCQTCYRHGYPWGSRGTVEYAGFSSHVEELTIGSVRLNTADDRPVSYMCTETGVGSGSVYYETDLFATHEDAAEAAEEFALERYGEEYTKERKRQERARTEDGYRLVPPDPTEPLRDEIRALKKTNKILKTHNKTLRAQLRQEAEEIK